MQLPEAPVCTRETSTLDLEVLTTFLFRRKQFLVVGYSSMFRTGGGLRLCVLENESSLFGSHAEWQECDHGGGPEVSAVVSTGR